MFDPVAAELSREINSVFRICSLDADQNENA